MKRKLSKILALCLCLLVVGSVTVYAGDLYLPERRDYGALWNQYEQEPENSVDLLVFGSSFAYCAVVPAELYRQTGVTAWVMAAPTATASVVYYYVREALNTQSPKAVMVEATSFFFRRYEDFTKVDLGYMPWGVNRLEATFRAAEPAERTGLLFPLYNYHSRWQDVPLKAYLTGRTDRVQDPLAGYTFLDTAEPQPGIVERTVAASEEEFAENLEYLDKIIALCEERKIDLTLFYAPTCFPVPEAYKARLSEAAGSVRIRDFTPEMAAIGLDLEKDFFDHSHLNCVGAEKYSRYLAAWLDETLSLPPTRGEDQALWNSRVEYWDELLRNGKLKMEN